jgi:hypothetical protein
MVLILSQFDGTTALGLVLREVTGGRYQQVGFIDLRQDYDEFMAGTGMNEEEFNVYVKNFIDSLHVEVEDI